MTRGPGTTAMRRIVVVGNSGSGKTTLANELARRLQLGRVELDALNHGPGWTPAPPDQLRAATVRALDSADRDQDGWVVCGNYSHVRGQLWGRADTIIWLDFPRSVVMFRVLRRTASRLLRRTELWNGNRERLGAVLALHDPYRSIVRWTWDGVQNYRRELSPLWGDPNTGPQRWLRFHSPRQLRTWLATTVGEQPSTDCR